MAATQAVMLDPSWGPAQPHHWRQTATGDLYRYTGGVLADFLQRTGQELHQQHWSKIDATATGNGAAGSIDECV